MTDSSDTEFGFADDAHRYQLVSRIATGGMGEVWRATDTLLGRQVAVKLLKTEYADDPSFRSRFETEARHAASLHHPNVAAVYDFGGAAPTDGSGVHRPYLVMELVDGQPLSALLRPGEPLDADATRVDVRLERRGNLLRVEVVDGADHAFGVRRKDGRTRGRTPCNRIAHVSGDGGLSKPGDYLRVRIVRGLPNSLLAEVAA